MQLRKLEMKDIAGMLEWMHEEDCSKCFRFDTMNMDVEKAGDFVKHSFSETDRHYAIVDGQNEYLGTVSLKNINSDEKNAEYAIALRKKARGNGTALQATECILRIAFEEMGLREVYLNVITENVRAVKFYEKYGFTKWNKNSFITTWSGEEKELTWYHIDAVSFRKKNAAKQIGFKCFGDERGSLVAVEGGTGIPFEIARVFYIYGTRGNTVRGCHANRKTKFFMVCVHGSVRVKIDNGMYSEEFLLCKANEGI